MTGVFPAAGEQQDTCFTWMETLRPEPQQRRGARGGAGRRAAVHAGRSWSRLAGGEAAGGLHLHPHPSRTVRPAEPDHCAVFNRAMELLGRRLTVSWAGSTGQTERADGLKLQLAPGQAGCLC